MNKIRIKNRLKIFLELSLIIVSLSILSNISYANNSKVESCTSVYDACLEDTGLAKDQILMGVRGICRDQQSMCQKFKINYEKCIKDYGMKVCKRIYQI